MSDELSNLYVAEVKPEPTCSICGAVLTPTGYICASCGETPEPSSQIEAAAQPETLRAVTDGE